MNKKVFIIGGAGFIGSHLAESLWLKGYNVFIYDDFSTGNKNNLDEVSYTECSIEDGIRECDYIYHLAASVGVKYVNDNPIGAIINNIDLERQVFSCNEKYKKPLFFSSSSEVYGNSDNLPFVETSSLSIGEPTQGRWGYSCSKLMGEFLALHSDFPAVVGRFFNVTGEGQVSNYGMVLPSFIERGLNGDPLEVYGDGSAVRCFSYVREVVDVMERLMTNEHCYNNVFNIGNSNNIITMSELAKEVVYQTGNKSEIIMKDFRDVFEKNPTDVLLRIPDTTKVRSYVDWNPSVTNKEIISTMIQHKIIDGWEQQYVHSDINK